MTTTTSKPPSQVWTKGHYLISTDSSLIPVADVNAAFASPEVYWALSLPDDALRDMLDNSLCFGLFVDESVEELTTETSKKWKLIGLARCITDYVTFLYLTDVHIWPSYQGKGLGGWMVQCVQEVIEAMPHLRRSMLLTADWARSVPFYEKHMRMTVHESKRGSDMKSGEGIAIMMMRGPAQPDY
jgi:GNAT superfamily N-acetyltransferase